MIGIVENLIECACAIVHIEATNMVHFINHKYTNSLSCYYAIMTIQNTQTKFLITRLKYEIIICKFDMEYICNTLNIYRRF